MPLDSPVSPSSPSPLLSAASARDTVIALEAEGGPDRPWISSLALGSVVAVLLALCVVEVDVTNRTVGMLRACTENVELRSPATAVVETVFVENGQTVVPALPVVSLANPALTERRRTLEAECEANAIVRDAWWTLSEAIRERHDEGFSREGRFETAWAQRVWTEFAARDEGLARIEAKARRDAARMAALASRGLVSDREHEEAQHAAAASVSERSVTRARTAADWLARHRDGHTAWAKSDADRRQALEENRHLVLRAPVAGVVLDLVSLRPGAVVMAGQILGAISAADGFRVETAVPARAAALLRLGQRASVSFSALPATEWGSLDAVVESIAPDISRGRGAGEPSYRVTLRPLESEMHTRDGRTSALRKGFVADVRFHLGRTSLLRLLRQKTTDWIERTPEPAPLASSSGRRARSTPTPFCQPDPSFTIAGEIGRKTLV